jgi:hypothetical protein
VGVDTTKANPELIHSVLVESVQQQSIVIVDVKKLNQVLFLPKLCPNSHCLVEAEIQVELQGQAFPAHHV